MVVLQFCTFLICSFFFFDLFAAYKSNSALESRFVFFQAKFSNAKEIISMEI